MATNPLQSRNLRKIKTRFSTIMRNEKRQSAKIVKEVIDDAYDYAFELHDQMGLDLHFIRGGDFAKAVVQNGKTLEYESMGGVPGEPSLRNAEAEMLFEHIPNAPKIGTLGVVNAGMFNPPGATRVYKDEHEEEIFDKLGNRAIDKALDKLHNMKLI